MIFIIIYVDSILTSHSIYYIFENRFLLLYARVELQQGNDSCDNNKKKNIPTYHKRDMWHIYIK